MSPWIVVFLGVIAFCAFVQSVFFAVAAVATVKAASRLNELSARALREWPEVRDRLVSVSEDVADLSRRAREMAERTESAAESVARVTQRAGALARAVATLPIGPVSRIVAVARAVRYGIQAYRGRTARGASRP
jgi:hypothetical protein